MAADTIPLTLRIPRPLHAYLVREAESNYRSVNAEILAMLTTAAERDEDERFALKYGAILRREIDRILTEREQIGADPLAEAEATITRLTR